MAKRRTSVRKREREMEKRQRELRKSQKAAEKRERRLTRGQQDLDAPADGMDIAVGQGEADPTDTTASAEPGTAEERASS